jgi:hypothetical protein
MSARAIELMRIAASMIEDGCPDSMAEYDGTTCDGLCLAEDLRNEAESLEIEGSKD